MINFSAFEEARKKFKKSDMPFLSQLREKAEKKKQYQGLRILHNIPLTIEAVLKIEPLLLGGAEVTVSCVSVLEPKEEALEILKSAKADIQLDHNFKGDYDFHLDCCGELIHRAKPRIGAVELTQTGSELYKKANGSYPVISVDDSNLKLLEIIFGTGDGFIRALKTQTDKELYDKKFVVFGYGKVGRGIAHSLLRFTDNVAVVDIEKDAQRAALKRGIKYIDGREIEKIKQEIAEAHFVVTATGRKNLITDTYQLNKLDFNTAILANMGAYDEYGKNFEKKDVLFEKKPLNFCIEEPTVMKYLDPILYAHNIGIDLILSNKFPKGYHPFLGELAEDILKKWENYHNENLFNVGKYFY